MKRRVDEFLGGWSRATAPGRRLYFSLMAPTMIAAGTFAIAVGSWGLGIFLLAIGLVLLESLREDPESAVGRAWHAVTSRRGNE